jgi:hypothetical protein
MVERSMLPPELMSPQRMTVMISRMRETSPRMSRTSTVLMVLFLFRQVQVRERMLLADSGVRVAEDAAVGDADLVQAPVHRQVAAIGRFHITHYQGDRALARSFCLCPEWRS